MQFKSGEIVDACVSLPQFEERSPSKYSEFIASAKITRFRSTTGAARTQS